MLVLACTTPSVEPEPAAALVTTPEPATAPPPASPVPDPPKATTVTDEPGLLTVGPTPEFTTPEHASTSLEHDGVTVHAHARWSAHDELSAVSKLQVRIEFGGASGDASGLNYLGGGGDNSCDELIPELQELATLDDGRWLVDAQMTCRSGEDYFSASNDHTLLLIDPKRRHAEILWTGVDTGSNAMGVCVSSSVTSFILEGTTLRISKTEVTTLDREAAEQLPGAAEGCEPKPEHTQELARIELARTPP
jgi:hypothetical protein